MRLSEAVLLGLPEIRFTNMYWFEPDTGGGCSGCLVGAALHSAGSMVPNNSAIVAFHKAWPWTKSSFDYWRCPLCEHFPERCMNAGFPTALTHLANHYKNQEITKESIADYIRSIEPAEEEAPVHGEPAAAPVLEPAEIGVKSR